MSSSQGGADVQDWRADVLHTADFPLPIVLLPVVSHLFLLPFNFSLSRSFPL